MLEMLCFSVGGQKKRLQQPMLPQAVTEFLTRIFPSKSHFCR